jgi:hypothetical protein
MGIIELAFSSEANVFFTASCDRSIKKWVIDVEAKTITEQSALNISEADDKILKDNVDK